MDRSINSIASQTPWIDWFGGIATQTLQSKQTICRFNGRIGYKDQLIDSIAKQSKLSILLIYSRYPNLSILNRRSRSIQLLRSNIVSLNQQMDKCITWILPNSKQLTIPLILQFCTLSGKNGIRTRDLWRDRPVL